MSATDIKKNISKHCKQSQQGPEEGNYYFFSAFGVPIDVKRYGQNWIKTSMKLQEM